MGIGAVDRTQYSDREKAEALALMSTGMSLRATERETGVPFPTLSRWRSGFAVNEDTLQARNLLNENLAAKFEDVANKLVNSVARMTDDELNLSPVSQRMTGAGIAIDKMQLLRTPLNTVDSNQIEAAKAAALAALVGMGFAAGVASQTGAAPPLPVANTTDVVLTTNIQGDVQGDTTGVVNEYGANAASEMADGQRALNEARAAMLDEILGDAPTSAATTAPHTPDRIAPGDNALAGIDASPAVVGSSLGICMVCGEQPASKITRGGAHACFNCVPG